MQIEKIDRFMQSKTADPSRVHWHSPKNFPFRLSGFPWFQKEGKYRRLPVAPDCKIPEPVDFLANCTAGGQICFQTDSSRLLLKVQLTGRADMNHMPATGQCGFDCYIGPPEKKLYCSTTKYDPKEMNYNCCLLECGERSLRNITLNFPLYMGVEEVLIGLDEDAKVIPPPEYSLQGPVIFYGTSITQGGCASRPGMAYTNILSRKMNVECINMGFSGNGRGEPELATILTQIENPACIVLDYEANAGAEGVMEGTLGNFIQILRNTHPYVPILVVSKIRFAGEYYNQELLDKRLRLKQFQWDTVTSITNMGDDNIYFFDGSTLLGEDFDECTVDGVHPSDLGFSRMAKGLEPILTKILFDSRP